MSLAPKLECCSSYFKTNTKGGKIYCLNYKNVCKIKDEVYDYIKTMLGFENNIVIRPIGVGYVQ